MRFAAVLLVAAAASSARAETKEWTVEVTPVLGVAYVDSRTPLGFGGAAKVGFGVSEALSVHVVGSMTWHNVDATKTTAAGTIGAFSAMAGVTYTLDVIRLVPSFEGSIGVLGIRGSARFTDDAAAEKVAPASTALGFELGFGLDYLLTRHVALGVVVRYQAFLTDLSRIPVYLYAGPRLSLRFGG